MGRGCAPRALARSAPAAAHARAHAASPSPAPRARTHDRVGLHARSDPRRVSRHARRTRPRSAGRGPFQHRAAGSRGPNIPARLLPLLSTLLRDFGTPATMSQTLRPSFTWTQDPPSTRWHKPSLVQPVLQRTQTGSFGCIRRHSYTDAPITHRLW